MLGDGLGEFLASLAELCRACFFAIPLHQPKRLGERPEVSAAGSGLVCKVVTRSEAIFAIPKIN